MQRSRNDLSSDDQKRSFPFWELPSDEEANEVEAQLSLWIAVLEKVHMQLRALRTEDLGGYLDVRVYEDNFYVEDQLLSRLGATGIGISVWFNPPEQTDWTEPEHASTLTIPEPDGFSCQLDEEHFFKWLQEIYGVKEVRGHTAGLTVYLAVPALSDSALRNLIGLLFRYDIPMSFLRSQLTPKNERWFNEPDKDWYQSVFGDAVAAAT